MKPNPSLLFRPVLSSIRYFAASALSLGFAMAGTHEFTGTGTGLLWSTAPNWDSVPASGQDTILNFSGTGLVAGATITTQNDIATANPGNAFLLNKATFTYGGPGSGTSPSIVLSGNPLQFVTSSTSVAPAISFTATGTSRPVVTIQNGLIFDATVNISSTASTIGVLSGPISGVGGLTKTDLGQVNLSGNNSYSGTTTLSAGTLQVNATGLSSNSFLALEGGTLQTSGAQTFNRGLGLGGTTSFSHNGGGFSASGGLLTVNIGGSTGELVFGNTVGTNLVGTLSFGSLTASSKTLFQNGLDLNGAVRTINVTQASAAAGTDSAEISGAIRDSGTGGGLTKSGTGLLILSGTNTYTGTTSVTGGVLQATQGTGLSSGSFLALSGGAVYQSSGAFTRSLGTTGGGSFSINGGGFSANGGQLNVNVGGSGTPLNFGTVIGTDIVGTLAFGSKTSTHVTVFENGLNLNGANRNISVDTFSTNGSDWAEISGAITNSTGTAGLTKIGIGRLTLSGVNTYNGTTTITTGALVAANASALGTGTAVSVANATSLGLSGDITTGLGKTVTIAGSGYNSTGALQTFGGSNVWQGSVALNSANARLGVGTGGTSLEVSGLITGTNTANTLQVRTASASQIVKLSGANTYVGTTSLVNGIVSFDTIRNVGGGASNLGAPTTAANGIITLGVSTDFSSNVTLRYTGTGDTTDRVLNLQSGTVTGNILTATLDQSGAGQLKFTSALTSAGTSVNRNLILTGSTAGTGEISGAIPTASSVTKSGTGTWTLSGANIYTGATTVSAGTLILTGGSTTGGGNVSVSNGATLNVRGNYTIGSATTGNLTVAGGTTTKGTLSFADNAAGTLTLAGSSSIFAVGTGANSSILNFDLGNASGGVGTSDRVVTNAFNVASGGAVLNFNQITGTTLGAGAYTLVNFATATGTSNLVLGTLPNSPAGKVATFSLLATANAQQLIVRLGTVSTTNSAYWTGTESSVWNAVNGTTGVTNFTDNQAGTGAQDILPDATTDVYFSAATATAAYSTTLGQDFSVRSLNFTGTGAAASNAYTVGGTNLLTIAGGSTYGLTVAADSADHVISSRLQLGASQTWNLEGASSKKLTVSGVISGATSDLTVSGGRTLVLAAANTYRNTIVSAGSTVQVGSGAVGSLGTGTLTNDGTVDFARTGSTTVGTTISGGGDLVVSSGSVTLTGTNTYSGNTTIKDGANVLVQSDAALGTASGNTTLVNKGGSLRFSGGVTVAENFILQPQASAATNEVVIQNTSGNNTLTGAITLNGDGSNNFRFDASSGSLLTIQGNVTGNGSFTGTTGLVTRGNGNIAISGNLSGFNRLTVQGSNNSLTLSGANTYAGETVLSGTTTLIVNSLNSTGAGIMASSSLGRPTTAALGIISLSGGSTLRYVGTTGETTDRGVDMTSLAGATLDQSGGGILNFTGAIRNTAIDTVKTLTLTGTGTGEISGTIANRNTTAFTSVTKDGVGTWTLSGAAKTYTGATTVNGGELKIAGGGINSSTQINVTGATLSLVDSDVLAATAALTLNNGILIAGGATETLGTLALIGDNQLNLVTAGNAVFFANSSSTTWSSTLAILNWSGKSTGGIDGTDNRVVFGADATGLDPSQVSKISFLNPIIDGVAQTGIYEAAILANGEVVAIIPETSSTLLVMLGSVAVLGRRRRK